MKLAEAQIPHSFEIELLKSSLRPNLWVSYLALLNKGEHGELSSAHKLHESLALEPASFPGHLKDIKTWPQNLSWLMMLMSANVS